MGERIIFVSYSRQNREFVDRITSDLRSAGFELWRDLENLEPGTLSWERAIREAIEECKAVVLCASPDALESANVNGELDFAKRHMRPIYPVWIAGDEWVECVPLNMSRYHYSDCRNGNYAQGVKGLITTLKKALNLDKSLKLGLPTHEVIDIGIDQFDSGFQFANHVYLNYLQEWYETFTYGREWILANVDTKQIAVPWQWITQLHDEAAVDKLNQDQLFEKTSPIILSEVGIVPGSYWAVWDARRLKATVVFLNDAALLKQVLSRNGISEIDILMQTGRLTTTSLGDEVLSQYRYQIVIAAYNANYDRQAIIEA